VTVGFEKCTGGGFERLPGGGFKRCDCGCERYECSGDPVLSGAPLNAGYLVLRDKQFPRYPRWSNAQQAIVPSIDMSNRKAMLIVYHKAVHDGTKYIGLQDACRVDLVTRWLPAKTSAGGFGNGASGTYKHPSGSPGVSPSCTAYDENAVRTGFNYAAVPSISNPTNKQRFADQKPMPGQPFYFAGGDTPIYAASVNKITWSPTEAECTSIYGVVSSFAPAAGVPHTLVLYMRFWRSAYKEIPWDGVSWPSWWPDPPDSLPWDGAPPFHHNHGTLRDVGAGTLSGVPGFIPSTEDDWRVILLGAHTSCYTCSPLIKFATDSTGDREGTLTTLSSYWDLTGDPAYPTPNAVHKSIYLAGYGQPVFSVTGTSVTLQVFSPYPACTGTLPDLGDTWAVIDGVVVSAVDSHYYSVQLTLDAYPGSPRTMTVTFGDNVYVLKQIG
jgi:hypothetical protein